MKLLYGVQGTGNGHITRARALGPALREAGVEVDFIFSGRAPEHYFDMAPFGGYRTFRGLSFVTSGGAVQALPTLRQNRFGELWRDINALDLSDYDLVVSDFEPISAWAAKRQGKTCIGMGHQYAFAYPVPKVGDTPLARLLLEHFAPATVRLGLHYHHFDAPVLPPIVDVTPESDAAEPGKILVYLGFEDVDEVVTALEPLSEYTFVYYGQFERFLSSGHIQFKPLSRSGFQKDLASAEGVICNAGFELSSEAIQLGKKLLVKPVAGQMEQLSNALALSQLGLGRSMARLDSAQIRDWLHHFEPRRMVYPDVAAAIAEWIVHGDYSEQTVKQLVDDLWRRARINEAPRAASSGGALKQPQEILSAHLG